MCFSHLRWNFVFQRPQHVMSRFAREMNVIYWEEPVEIGRARDRLPAGPRGGGSPNVRVVVPHLPEGMPEDAARSRAAAPAGGASRLDPGHLIAWYYTPMMLTFSRDIDADLIVYDCMDELAKFRFAPEKLLDLEQELIDRADIVFTGGSSLYEAKKDRHPNVHCFPSSVDRVHSQGPGAPVRAGRPGGSAAAAPRLLRGDRRALRHRSASTRSPRCGRIGRS